VKRIIVLSVFILFTLQSSNSQDKISYELGPGFSFSGQTNKILENYGIGYSLGGSVTKEMRNNIMLTLNTYYSRYYHNENSPPLATPRIYGFQRITQGEPGDVYDISIGTRFFLSSYKHRPFFNINIGTMLTRDGAIVVREWISDSPEYFWEIEYKKGGTLYFDGYFSLGLGYELPIARSIVFIPHALVQISFYRNQIYYPIKLNFKIPF